MRSEDTKPKILVRRAQDSDREAVFNFCKRTWSWGDYIPKVWDQWLRDKDSRVFVATVDGVPVGITQLSIDKPHEVWLRGARTDPNHRQMGVATAITKKCLQYAKRKDAHSESKNSKWAGRNETGALWSYLQGSETYRKAAGLYTVLYHWFSLEKGDLERFVEQRKAIVHRKGGEIDGLMLIEDAPAREWHANTMQTCYIDGDYDSVFETAKFLQNHCYALGVKKIYGFTPNHKPVTDALEELGFKMPEAISIVYEKKI
jgi:GNAT superfamily N-acetyltransferase